jgi:arylsulfatase A-like enzyme
MRTRDFLYVEYRDGEHELYDLRQDPFELHNLASGLTVQLQALLHSQLVALEQCHGGARCWAAMHTLSVLPSVKVPGIRLPRLK